MKRYGMTYQVADFIARLIPKRRNVEGDSSAFIHSVLVFLQQLDQLQESNPRITLSFHSKDGLWVYLDGAAQFFLKPTQKFLLLHIFKENQLSLSIGKVKGAFQTKRQVPYADCLWDIQQPEFLWLLNYATEKWASLEVKSPTTQNSHPRYIPGIIRQLALTEFITNGRVCNGVFGRIKEHRVSATTPIEFDHILPHSQGGGNTEWNVQVLCQECNRLKRATAQ